MRVTVACCAVVLAGLIVGSEVHGQTVVLRQAPKLKFRAPTDSNSPTHWDGETFYVFNSAGHPVRSKGTSQFDIERDVRCEYDNEANGGRWIECTWRADDGTVYGWYHHEPRGLCPGTKLTAPKIGAARSKDNGAHWTDLGIVLEARPNTLDCDYKNGFFAGGNGDFSAMLDQQQRYLYLFISTYAGAVEEQGVSVARMEWKHRDQPVGRVWKHYQGKWAELGIGGRVTPIFQAKISWKEENADAFWGPSVHWNTHLRKHVILLNRTRHKPGWPQEGVYISHTADLANPTSWSKPEKILDGGSWYPQVLGVNAQAKETDKLCGKQARFYMHGVSEREMLFFKEGEDTSKLPPLYQPG